MANADLDRCILGIVQANEVREQSELKTLLIARGHDVPQSTISRHLKKLKIAKVGGIYRTVEFDPIKTPPVLNAKISDSGIVVFHTYPGHANSLAYFIDQRYVSFSPKDKKENGILGTIAGDDTVILILKSRDVLKEVLKVLEKEISIPEVS